MSEPPADILPKEPIPYAQPQPGKPGAPPESKVCPNCGGTKYKRVPSSKMVSFASDRVCQACNTRYTPPTPLWASIIFIVFGGLLTLFFGLACIPVAARLFASGSGGSSDVNPMGLVCPLSLFILGVLALVHGIKSIIK